MPHAGPHILVETTNKADCRFFATWLVKAAEAQEFWSQAMSDPDFADEVILLHIMSEPDLAAFALESRHHVAVLDLYADEMGLFCIELTMMVQLGFFVWVGGRYQMAVPEKITFATVKQAAFDLSSTVSDWGDVEIIEPECLLHLLSREDAETWRSRLIEMRHFNASAPSDRRIQ
jgi:hypothetical protein